VLAEAPDTAVSDLLVVLRDFERAFAVLLEKHVENLGFAFFASGADQHMTDNEGFYSSLVSRTSLTSPLRCRELDVVVVESNGVFLYEKRIGS
jgi:hypothetical protein